jgi:SAM-dependent methyltransferase
VSGGRPRALVAIANHGTKNAAYLERVLENYRSMRHFSVDLVVLSDVPKALGGDVTVLVGAPAKDPWSLPFKHRDLFYAHRDDYDLFIYSEDDTLLEERNLLAFLEVNEVLPTDQIPGFMRYERDLDGHRWFNDAAFGFHWDPGSVRCTGGQVFARFTNPHAACYVLTADQLKRCITSGGYLVPPHAGRYDMLVSGATDPYTQCGLTKLIPISRLEDFLLHHLPNTYVGRMGQAEPVMQAQVRRLAMMAREGEIGDRLFPSETRYTTDAWDKRFDEQVPPGLETLVPQSARSVLSIGAGTGEAEIELFGPTTEVTAVPLDVVIAAAAEQRGITTTSASWAQARDELQGSTFDVVLLLNVLQHVAEPVSLLQEIRGLLAADGVLVATVPNHLRARLRRILLRPGAPRVPTRRSFTVTGVHGTSEAVLRKWLHRGGFRPVQVDVLTVSGAARLRPLPSRVLGTDVAALAVADKARR